MIKKNVPWRILVERLLSYGNEVSYTKKECARAHSRAEARLLWQPSTLAPSAHPRGAFIIVWKRSFLYDNKAETHTRCRAFVSALF